MSTDTAQQQPMHMTTLMIQVTELRAQVSGMDSKLNRIEGSVTSFAHLDKALAELAIHNQDTNKQINALWTKFDALNEWRTSHDGDAAVHINKVMTYCDEQIAAFRAQALVAIDKVDVKVDSAAANVAAMTNQAKGFRMAVTVASLILGGLFTGGITWAVTTLQASNERLAVIEYKLQLVGTRK